MNKKSINRYIAILNVFTIIALLILNFSIDSILSTMMVSSESTTAKCMYNNGLIDFFVNNVQIIMIVVYAGVGIINIISSIQNRKNKKIFFWQLVFGICEIVTGLSISVFMNNEDIIDWINKILFGIVPIILAIINIVLIKRNKPRLVQVISYVVVIILSILIFLDIIGEHWDIIAIIMQFIYIHSQEKNIDESRAKKIVNIILYYVLQTILVIGFLVITLISLIVTKVNDTKWNNQLSELFTNFTTLPEATNEELYIPVENNYKYGFINQNGEEKISCQYDRVSFFFEIEFNNSKYYVALAKKDNKYYLISKSNDSIPIENYLNDKLQIMDNWIETNFTKGFNEEENDRLAYLSSYENLFASFTKVGEIALSRQSLDTIKEQNSITLTNNNDTYYFSSNNYSMNIEPRDDDYNKYNVTITKSDGEKRLEVLYLPGMDEIDNVLNTFSNGYIKFENEDQTSIGWIDNEGNLTTVPNGYDIKNIIDDKVTLEDQNGEQYHYIIIDFGGHTLLQSNEIDIYNNIYLVKDNNNKMVLLDKDLNIISKEYDKIITTTQVDISAPFSSYKD